MEIGEEAEEIKRSFTINKDLLDEFKEVSKQQSKTYKRTIAEAIDLWLKNK